MNFVRAGSAVRYLLVVACHASKPDVAHGVATDAAPEASAIASSAVVESSSPSINTARDAGPVHFVVRDADNTPLPLAHAQHLLETTGWAADNRVTLVNTQGDKRTPTTCVEFLAAVDDGFGDAFEMDIPNVSSRRADCRAISLLGHASGSAVSHVASLHVRDDFRDITPSAFAFGAVVDAGATWHQAAPLVKRGRVDEAHHTADYVDPTPLGVGYAYTLRIVGFGDVDGDGLEDVVVTLLRSNVPQGHMTWSEGFVLTRDTDRGPLRIVKQF